MLGARAIKLWRGGDKHAVDPAKCGAVKGRQVVLRTVQESVEEGFIVVLVHVLVFLKPCYIGPPVNVGSPSALAVPFRPVRLPGFLDLLRCPVHIIIQIRPR